MKTFIDAHTLGQEGTWFSDWFDSPFYHILYQDRNEQEARFFMDNLAEKLAFNTQHHLLDMACGRGRHAIYLNEKGFEVTGIDLSKKSISTAETSSNDRLHFAVQDMRVPFTENKFDFVLNLFSSFGYFESESENLEAIVSMTNALKSKGKLVIDFFNPNKVIHDLVAQEVKTVEGIEFHITRKLEKQFIIKNIRFTHQNQAYHFEEKVKAIDLDEFREYFAQAGLLLLETFGNYSLAPHEVRDSPRLILVAQKID